MNNNEIPNPFEIIEIHLQALRNEVLENRKMIVLLSRAKNTSSSGDEYKTVEEIAQMFGVQKETIRKSLIPHSTEIEVLQNGKGGKKLVNFTQYRKVFRNGIS